MQRSRIAIENERDRQMRALSTDHNAFRPNPPLASMGGCLPPIDANA